jgi:diacylglycerol kinase family enzyme
MLYVPGAAAARAGHAVRTGLESLTLRSARPIALQADGEYLGEIEAVKFQFVPHALRIVALLRGPAERLNGPC